MKLSDKVLLGFFCFIFIYLNAAFIEVRMSGTRNSIDDNSGRAESVDIRALSYVVLNDLHHNINITGADRNRLEVRSLSGDLLKDFRYEISGDTLKLSQANSTIKEPVRVLLFVSGGLKGISVKSSEAVFRNVRLEHLHVLENSGHVWISGSSIPNIDLDLSNGSSFDIAGPGLDTLSLRINRSNVNVPSSVEVVRGSMENDSFLLVSEPGEIHLKKDKTSRLSLY